MRFLRPVFLACTTALTLAATPVHAETITFDSAVAAFTPTPGVTQEVTTQFASLGVIFEDRNTPGRGAIIGRCGPGEGSGALFGYGADYPGCGDTTPNFDIVFVLPTDLTIAGVTDAFSIQNYDGLIRASAYDVHGALLGTTQTTSGLLNFSGIGAIHRVNLLSLDGDPTTLDTLSFNTVTAAVPEPEAALLVVAGLLCVAGLRRKSA